ncbi:hypothetical protein RFI_09451 [Reticulomyxa filosa]|uniref:Uncharacterized protein n=1 Tax=Reticulomyxa filosa TaxID=46433 RepID=X6NPP8_RETFI|nr:hypothetical protein RFI_09451 [Reticulomyxa filosa]|eukprot:ETO27679.1 hypothetical protein RFI_09451 [Reticulomyxa filosa]
MTTSKSKKGTHNYYDVAAVATRNLRLTVEKKNYETLLIMSGKYDIIKNLSIIKCHILIKKNVDQSIKDKIMYFRVVTNTLLLFNKEGFAKLLFFLKQKYKNTKKIDFQDIYRKKDFIIHNILISNKLYGGMNGVDNQIYNNIHLTEKEINIILENWIRLLSIDLGWIDEFNKLIARYAKYFKLLKTFHHHNSVVTRVKFSPDGSKIVSSSYDKTIRILDVESGKQIQILKGHSGWVLDSQFSPKNDNIILSCSKDKTIRIWDIKLGKEKRILEGHLRQVTSASFSPKDNNIIISSSHDKTIRLWNIENGKEIKRFEGHLDVINDVQFSFNGNNIVSSSNDNTICIWDIITGERIHILKGHTASVMKAHFSPSGLFIISGSYDKTIRIWGVISGRELKKLKDILLLLKMFNAH